MGCALGRISALFARPTSQSGPWPCPTAPFGLGRGRSLLLPWALGRRGRARKDLRPGPRRHAFLIAAGPGEGAPPGRGPRPPGHLPPAGPFPPGQDRAPRPLPEPPQQSLFLWNTPLLGPRRKFDSREGRNGHRVTGVPDPLTQAPGEAREEGVERRLAGRRGVIAIFPVASGGRRGLTDWPPLLLESRAACSLPWPSCL